MTVLRTILIIPMKPPKNQFIPRTIDDTTSNNNWDVRWVGLVEVPESGKDGLTSTSGNSHSRYQER